MRKDVSIIELAQGWAHEDARRAPAHSEAELAAVNDLLYGDGYGDPKRRPERIRQFATSTGSAAVLTADVTARTMQPLYTHAPRVMRNVVRVRKDVPDFKAVEAIRFDGAETTLPAVLEKGEYGQITISQSQSDTYRVVKHGALFEVTEEAIANDPVGVFATLPERMARGAVRTEEAFLTSMFFDSGGPIDAFYSTQTGGAPATLPLTITNLKTAVGQMLSYADSDGDPIMAMPRYLMVGPGLMIEAMTILNSISLNHVVPAPDDGDGSAVPYGQKNVLADLGIQLLVNPWIASLVTSGTIASTCWSLFTDPANIPAGEFGTLAGYETPQVTVPTGMDTKRIQTDVFTWKCKHVFGGTTIDKRAVWGSFGQ